MKELDGSFISVWIWICFCFSTTSRPHFHYTLSYKRKINIIGKGHLEIGIATYFWLAKLMNPNDNVYNVHSTAFHAYSQRSSFTQVFVHLLTLSLVYLTDIRVRYISFYVVQTETQTLKHQRCEDEREREREFQCCHLYLFSYD